MKIRTSTSRILLIALSFLFACTPKGSVESQTTSSSADSPRPGGICDGCELLFVGMPLKLNSIDTSAGWETQKQKLVITGKVFHQDKKRPAQDVILYYYHTDDQGIYAPKQGMIPSTRKHGHLRGWVKTGPDGAFSIYTSRPGSYPDGNEPAHIHVFIKEPRIDVPYYIDEWIFDNDPLLTAAMRKKKENRGGSGILKTSKQNGIEMVTQNVILGLNIPAYPKE
jgi:protocatechuate 3,4-dioxygenase beta subunit